MLEVDLQAMWVYGDMTGSEQGKSERKPSGSCASQVGTLREEEEEVRKHMLMFLFISFTVNTG